MDNENIAFAYKAEVIDALLKYLAKKPYEEVYAFMEVLQKGFVKVDISAQQE